MPAWAALGVTNQVLDGFNQVPGPTNVAAAPPEATGVVFEDALTAPGAMTTSTCQTGRAGADFTAEGILIRVAGRCQETAQGAGVFALINPGRPVADAEVRIDFKAVAGQERARLAFGLRASGRGSDGYMLTLSLAEGIASLNRLTGTTGGILAQRSDALAMLSRSDWNSLAVRMQGPNIWVLLNEQLLLSASDSSYPGGGLYASLTRSGPIDDEQETSVLLRNLRLSRVASAPVAAPGAQPTAPVPSVPSLAPPPAVGATVYSDPTFSFFGSFTCPSGRNKAEPVGEGYILKVTGPCSGGASAARVGASPGGLIFPDGEIRFDFKLVSGRDRAQILLLFRITADESAGYFAAFAPAAGVVGLGSSSRVLVARSDVGGAFSLDDWNSVSIRASGSNMWVLVNDQLVAQAHDSESNRGELAIMLARLGDVNDTAESAAVLRNLRVSGLAEGDPDRVPHFE
jgi:hypothetical protein